MIRIVVIGDDSYFNTGIKRCFESHSWKVKTVAKWAEISEDLCSKQVDIVIVSLSESYQQKKEALQATYKVGPQVDIIITSSNFTIDDVVQGAQNGIKEFIKKTSQYFYYVDTIHKVVGKKNNPMYLARRLDMFVHHNCHKNPFKIISLCENFQLSSSYISKLLHKHIGVSFRKRVVFYRVQHAKNLMETTDCPLYMIAEKCGFKNQHRLSESFKKIEGISPQRYRERLRERKVHYIPITQA